VNRVRANGEGMGCTQREPTALFVSSEDLNRDNGCPIFIPKKGIILIPQLEFQDHQESRAPCVRIDRSTRHLRNSTHDMFQGI
jgi:hypothetical protein